MTRDGTGVVPHGFDRRRFMTALTASVACVSAADGHAAATPGAADGDARQLCVFSKHLQWLDYGDMAEFAAEMGFDGVDLTVRPGGHVLPERVEDDLPRAVDAVKKAGLDAPMMATAVTDPDDPLARRVLTTAAGLGIRYYRMGYLPYDGGKDIMENLDGYRPRMRELAVLNRELGLHGAYQNHAGTNVGAPVWDLWYLLRDLDPRWIGCQYDIRHATVEGGNSWPLGLRLVAPYVRTTVVKDFVWAGSDGSWKVDNVPVGKGMVDFPAYYRMVNRLGFSGPVSLHFEYPLEETREASAAAMGADLRALRGYIADAGL